MFVLRQCGKQLLEFLVRDVLQGRENKLMRIQEHIKHSGQNLNVVQVEVNQLGVIVLDPLDGFLHICVVGRIHREELLLSGFRNAIPSQAHGLTLVEQGGVVLVLIHHRVEAEDGGQIDDLLLRGIVKGVFVLLAHVNGDLFFGLDVAGIPWRWDPLLSTNLALNERLELRLIRGLDGLLIDVLDQLLAIERPGGFLGAFIAIALVWRQEVVLQEQECSNYQDTTPIQKGYLHRDPLLWPVWLSPRGRAGPAGSPHPHHRTHSDPCHTVWRGW